MIIKKHLKIFILIICSLFVSSIIIANKSNLNKKTFQIGMPYQGGVIFYIDSTGEHGLICSMIDIVPNKVEWSNVHDKSINYKSSDKSGYNNSVFITKQEGHKASAAQLCLDYINIDYGTGVYDDWYLPSSKEFELLVQLHDLVHKDVINKVNRTIKKDNNPSTIEITAFTYWTSSEFSSLLAIGGSIYKNPSNDTKSTKNFVRAIRPF